MFPSNWHEQKYSIESTGRNKFASYHLQRSATAEQQQAYKNTRFFNLTNLQRWVQFIQAAVASNTAGLQSALNTTLWGGKHHRKSNNMKAKHFTGFSIIPTITPEGEKKLVVPTSFVAGSPGTYGVPKIAYELVVSEDGSSCTLLLDVPLVLKVYPRHRALVDQTLQKTLDYWQQLYAANYPHCYASLMGARNKRYQVIPYFSAFNLDDFVKQYSFNNIHQPNSNRLNLKQKLAIAIAIAKQVKRLHDKNLCHRDLKLDNMLINPLSPNEFEIKIIDLDTVCVSGSQGILAGTWLYSAPDLFKEFYDNSKGYITAQLHYDIYSLGIIFAALFIGRVWQDVDRDKGCYYGAGILNSRYTITEPNNIRCFIQKTPNVSNLDCFRWHEVYKLQATHNTEHTTIQLRRQLKTNLSGKQTSDDALHQQLGVQTLIELLKAMMSEKISERPPIIRVINTLTFCSSALSKIPNASFCYQPSASSDCVTMQPLNLITPDGAPK
jgi:serine/threonine protein kinase